VSKLTGRDVDREWRAANLLTRVLNGSLLALWLWLYRAVYPYLGVIFTRQEFRTNQIVLVGALFLIFSQVRKGQLRPHFNAAPQLYWPALALALGSSALYLVIEHFLDINTFSATLFGMASYGLLGLWMSPRVWRQGLPAALLLVGALPFGEHLQTFVGYPVRIFTAALVRDGLSIFGVHSVGVDTILVFENGITKVDLPCSGVKSLWTGGLFLLAATWIERRRINVRWFLVVAAFIFLLLAANLLRVAILVLVGQIAGWMLLAEMLHVPLGVLGFAGACAAAAIGLRFTAQAHSAAASGAPAPDEARLARPGWLAPVMAGILLVFGLLYSPLPQTVTAHALPVWEFPTDLQAVPWQLSPGEQEWLRDSEVESAERWRFSWRGLSGSMLFVTSTTWRAHHRPERCFEVYGLEQDNPYTHLVADDFPVRMLSLGTRAQPNLYSAAYWLQSASQTTDDYATRIWADIAPDRQPWVLVTILFDAPYDPRAGDAQALYLALKQVVHEHLMEGIIP